MSLQPVANWRARGRKTLFAILRVSLGGLFIYAGVLKLETPQSFADSIASFRLLPAGFIDLMAIGLPPFEILLGLWLISGWRRRQAAFCALALTTVFLLALGSTLARGITVDCGCFGSGGDPLVGNGHTVTAIGRDGLLLVVAIVLYVLAAREDQGPATR